MEIRNVLKVIANSTRAFSVEKTNSSPYLLVDTTNDTITIVGATTHTGNLTLTGNLAQTGDATITGALTTTGGITNYVLQSAEHGAGAIGTAFAPRTYRWTENGHIITEIHVDLTGLKVKGDIAKDAIGLGAGGAAYIGRYVVATYGVVYKIEMMCIELPAGAATTTDIDLGAEDVGTTAYDGAVDDVVINTAALVAGETAVTNVPALTANDYIYLIEGDTAATAGTYTAGQYIIRFYGHAVIS